MYDSNIVQFEVLLSVARMIPFRADAVSLFWLEECDLEPELVTVLRDVVVQYLWQLVTLRPADEAGQAVHGLLVEFEKGDVLVDVLRPLYDATMSFVVVNL